MKWSQPNSHTCMIRISHHHMKNMGGQKGYQEHGFLTASAFFGFQPIWMDHMKAANKRLAHFHHFSKFSNIFSLCNEIILTISRDADLFCFISGWDGSLTSPVGIKCIGGIECIKFFFHCFYLIIGQLDGDTRM